MLLSTATAGSMVASCLLPSDPGSPRVRFTLPQDTVRLGVADSAAPSVSAQLDGATLTGAQLRFESADTSLIAISTSGMMRARRRGSTYVRVRFVSAATGDSPPIDSFPVRAVVSRVTVPRTTLTLGALGDTIHVRPGFLDAAGNSFGASDSATATAALRFDLISAGNAITIQPAGVIAAVNPGTDSVRMSIDTCRRVLTILVQQQPARLAYSVQPGSAVAGATLTPAVTLTIQDSLGHAIASATDFVTIGLASAPAGGTLSGTLGRSAVNGVATFNDLSIDKAGSDYSLIATATGLTSATSSLFGVIPAGATKLAFLTQPSRTPKSSVIVPAVQVVAQDAFGNTVPAFTGTITLAIGAGSPGGATLGGTLSVAASGGVATYSDLSINKVGTNYRLTATTSGLTSATSNTFNVTAPSALAFVAQPSTAGVNASITPAVQVAVEDAFGAIATGYSGSIAMAITSGTGTPGATLNGTLTVAVVNGVGTFGNLSVTLTGTSYQLTATDPGGVLAAATSSPFDIQ